MVCMNALGHQKDLKKDCKMYRFCHNNTIFVLKTARQRFQGFKTFGRRVNIYFCIF